MGDFDTMFTRHEIPDLGVTRPASAIEADRIQDLKRDEYIRIKKAQTEAHAIKLAESRKHRRETYRLRRHTRSSEGPQPPMSDRPQELGDQDQSMLSIEF